MTAAIPAVVIGAGGYVGGELLRLISAHPNFELAAAISDSRKGRRIGDTFGHLASSYPNSNFVSQRDWQDTLADHSDVALFSAAPHGAAAATIAETLTLAKALNVRMHIVDCSADFRFRTRQDWENIYAAAHGAPGLIDDFSCAVPEHVKGVSTDNVAHPGCFATAALLATVPLLQSNIVETDLFVSGVTGSTGSGRSPQAGTHHPERHSNFYAYKPLAHRHSAEIVALSKAASGRSARIHFVPHSGPFARGMHVTLQAKLTSAVSEQELREIYAESYRDAPFVQVLPGMPRIKDVASSNFCHIGVAVDGESVVVMSVIDNLVKGAAGGAMQWMNRLWALPEASGLSTAAPGWT